MPFGDASAFDVDGDANLDIVSIFGVQHGAGGGGVIRVLTNTCAP